MVPTTCHACGMHFLIVLQPSSRCDPTSGGLVSAISAEQAGSPSAEVRLLEGQNFSGLQGSDQGDVG